MSTILAVPPTSLGISRLCHLMVLQYHDIRTRNLTDGHTDRHTDRTLQIKIGAPLLFATLEVKENDFGRRATFAK